jgi:polar amino acid transport system substrate-binding protein
MKRILCLVAIFLSVACSKKPQEVTIGVDPSFFPLEIQGKETNVFAFITELLQMIAKEENLSFERITTSWDNLLWGLREGQYQAAISSLDMYVFNTAKYSFSEMCLPTGPVLVVPVDSVATSFADFEGQTIAVEGEEAAKYVVNQDPNVTIQVYATFIEALNAVDSGAISGALLPYIPAVAYVNNVYQGQLKIASHPIMDQGLRLITNKEADPKLMKQFNRGLEKLKASGQLDQLKKKWALL